MQTDADRVTQSIKPLGPFGSQNRPAPNYNAPRTSNPAGPILPPARQACLPGFASRVRRRIHEPHAGRFSRFLAKAPCHQVQLDRLVGVPLAAILFQVYVPRFITYLSYLELPLLVTVYFPLMRRSPVMGVFFGAGIGLAQDSLSHLTTLWGCSALSRRWWATSPASVGQRFEVENSAVRLVLAFFFFFFHHFFLWVLRERPAGRGGRFRSAADAGARRSQRGSGGSAVPHLG